MISKASRCSNGLKRFSREQCFCSVRESEDRAVMFIYRPDATSFFRQAFAEMLDGGMIVRKGKVMHEF